MRIRVLVPFLCGFVLLTPPPAVAQNSTGSIRGYVTDTSGAPIQGARIVAASALTSAQRAAISTGRGYYALLGLVPGEYDVTVRYIRTAPQKCTVREVAG